MVEVPEELKPLPAELADMTLEQRTWVEASAENQDAYLREGLGSLGNSFIPENPAPVTNPATSQGAPDEDAETRQVRAMLDLVPANARFFYLEVPSAAERALFVNDMWAKTKLNPAGLSKTDATILAYSFHEQDEGMPLRFQVPNAPTLNGSRGDRADQITQMGVDPEIAQYITAPQQYDASTIERFAWMALPAVGFMAEYGLLQTGASLWKATGRPIINTLKSQGHNIPSIPVVQSPFYQIQGFARLFPSGGIPLGMAYTRAATGLVGAAHIKVGWDIISNSLNPEEHAAAEEIALTMPHPDLLEMYAVDEDGVQLYENDGSPTRIESTNRTEAIARLQADPNVIQQIDPETGQMAFIDKNTGAILAAGTNQEDDPPPSDNARYATLDETGWNQPRNDGDLYGGVYSSSGAYGTDGFEPGYIAIRNRETDYVGGELVHLNAGDGPDMGSGQTLHSPRYGSMHGEKITGYDGELIELLSAIDYFNGKTSQQIRSIQELGVLSGLLTEGSFVPGIAGNNTIRFVEIGMGVANRDGYEIDPMLERLAQLGDWAKDNKDREAREAKFAARRFIAPAYQRLDAAEVNNAARRHVSSILKREAEDWEIALYGKKLQQDFRSQYDATISEQRNDWEAAGRADLMGDDEAAGKTFGGGTVQAVDPMARMRENFYANTKDERDVIEQSARAKESYAALRNAVGGFSLRG